MGGANRELGVERVVGRYAIYDEIASGGMAVVHIGRMIGEVGFARTVAIKRLHPAYAKDPGFVSMLLDEARLAARIRHPNAVAPLDIVMVDNEVFLVMEFVFGDTFAHLLRTLWLMHEPVPPAIVVSVMIGALQGLHAAHEAVSDDGVPLDIVHRDVSPQNIMVGVDGIARVLDFGVAKAAIRSQSTGGGEIKGKVAYMAPEQARGGVVDRRTDLFAAGVVCWEALTGQRLFHNDELGAALRRVLSEPIRPPSAFHPAVSPQLDEVVLHALKRDRGSRFQTARDFAIALERAVVPASAVALGDWVRKAGGKPLAELADRVAAIERHSSSIAKARAARWERPKAVGTPREAVGTPPKAACPSHPIGQRPTDESVGRSRTTCSMRPRWHLAMATGIALLFAGIEVGELALRHESQSTTTPAPIVANPSQVPTTLAPIAVNLSHASIEPEQPTSSSESALSVTAVVPAPAAGTDTTAQNGGGHPAGTSKMVFSSRSSVGSSRRPPFANKAESGAQQPAKPSCTPPFYLDAKGIRRIRLECIDSGSPFRRPS